VGGQFLFVFAVSFVVSLRLAILQASVPPEIQGRVITIALNSTAATEPVGLAIAASLAGVLDVRVWYVLNGIITIAMGVGAFFIPAIMHIEDRVNDVGGTIVEAD